MSDSISTEPSSASIRGPASPPGSTAGGLLRQAREARGLRLEVLAATIKVTTAKLEALETDRFERLPDATFTRALAQAVCRSLKVDPVPVLALLPPPNGHRLEEVAEGLKTPFHERPGRLVPGQWLKLSAATVWIAALLVVAALLLYVMPAGWITIPRPAPASAASSPDSVTGAAQPVPPGADGAPRDAAAFTGGEPAAPSSSTVESTVAAPSTGALPSTALAPVGATPGGAAPGVAPTAATASTPSGSVAGAALQVTTTGPSWIGVTDAGGKSLIGRLVQPGETVDLDGAMPLTLRLGHASTVQLKFRGEPVDLKKYIRDDVARLQLK